MTNGNVSCPKCGSVQINALQPKSFSTIQALIGACFFGFIGMFILGPAGVLFGALLGLLGGYKIGGKKIKVACMNCGKQWTPSG